MSNLDSFDRSILRVLQTDGKIGNQDLAEKVSLSSSPCWRRVKKLEDSGVIDRYVATIAKKRLKHWTTLWQPKTKLLNVLLSPALMIIY
jgi:DNA-binding Lrp family transcriptional regulator